MLLWAGVALFCACIGKSGQFPLHTWLPDAMAGPTPVSSLLHSSTMVVAGVFLVARLYPVFWEAFSIPDVSINLIVLIAGITIVISALLAFVQNDIKKVLAYSTVGQLGYMMLGLGAGAWLPAVFHIFTHAFFKCALFLCAGSVSHSGSHHSFDMKQDMGGLAKKMPITATCWIIAALALAGVFPLAGFFSKDEIIDNVGHNGYTVFMWIALGGAFLTAAYTVRATYLTFFGTPRGAAAGHGHDELGAELSSHDIAHDIQQEGELEHELPVGTVLTHDDGHGGHGDDHGDHGDHVVHGPHESPKLILIPICILAFLALVAGFTNATAFGEEWENFKEYVEPRPEAVSDVAAAEAEAGDRGPAAPGRRGGRRGWRERGGRGGPRRGLRVHRARGGHGLLLPAGQPRRVHVVEGRALARRRGGRPGVAAGSSASPCTPAATAGSSGSPTASDPARVGYAFLANKYYLDDLYEKVIVRAIAHPIAAAAYWVNQHVIDGVVNAAGKAGRIVGGLIYRNIDQARRRRRRQRLRHGGQRDGHRVCNPCSPASSASTADCSSGPPPSAPSCS